MKHLVLMILMTASVVSMAAPVKSVVGGKEIALGEDGGISAKSYIQDGLVAMWDGIENAGWGVHDPNATNRWVDLVNSSKALTLKNAQIEENAVRFNSSFAYVSSSQYDNFFSLAENITTEVCFSFVGYNQSETHIINSFFSRAFIYSSSLILGSSAKTVRVNVGWGANQHHSLSYIDDKTKPISVFVDGSLKEYANVGSTYSKLSYFSLGNYNHDTNHYPLNGRVFNCRIYNRALSAEEIAHNYAVDKARFNLP